MTRLSLARRLTAAVAALSLLAAPTAHAQLTVFDPSNYTQMLAQVSNSLKQISQLEQALNELNPFQKRCIELFYYRKMSYLQIVEVTGYSINEVKSYIQNGKRNLKLMLTGTK